MVVQSSATLEVMWVNRWHYGMQAEEISNPFHIDNATSWSHWDEYDHEDDYYNNLDDKDDEDWKPLKDPVRTTKENAQEREIQRTKRLHQRGFIIQTRELFGRLKDLKQLRELYIDWIVCSRIQNTSPELALDLLKETEAKGTQSK
ncbi:hypothetical protein EC991_009422 [Linnemannia zychae]|nr:hypothetical protein EC991_009422 [Linnemannia zychae]